MFFAWNVRVRVCVRGNSIFLELLSFFIRVFYFWIRFATPQASQEQVVIVADRHVVRACILLRVLYSSVSRK